MFETMKTLVIKKNFESHYQRVSLCCDRPGVFVGVNHIDNCRDQFTPRCLFVASEPVKKGAEVRKVKRCRIEAAISLPQLETNP